MPDPVHKPTAGVPLALLSVVIAMASIQTGAALGKQLFPAVGPAGATTLRLVFASIILAIVWRPWRHWPVGAAWRPILIYGAALGGMNLLFYMSLARIPLGVAVALEFTGPLAVAVASSRRALDWLYVAMAVAGVVILLPFHGAAAHLDIVGAGFALAAGACWALYIVFGQKSGAEAHGGAVASIGMLVASAVVLPVGISQAGADMLSPALLPAAIGVAILSSALPYSLEMLALKRLPTQTFSILMSGEPALGALSGLLFLGEHLSVSQWLAIGLIIAASAGSSLSAQRRAMSPEIVP
ncbi:EamA family transporter [Aquabacter sp. CN5-332]|uniref:EamA family transporter n=1 Tax=Aquabacter sp. CN5-332 TaxID=3156608 RepID=UPI0032B32A00